jgi:hypothetical protein
MFIQDLCESMHKRGYRYCSFQKEMMTPVAGKPTKEVFMPMAVSKPNKGLYFSLIGGAVSFDEGNCTKLVPQWYTYTKYEYEEMHEQLSSRHLIFAKFDESSLQKVDGVAMDWAKVAETKKGVMATSANNWDVDTVVVWDFGAMSDVEVYRNVGSYQYDTEPVASAAEFYRAPDHCNVM